MKILITGATGFVGSHCVEYFSRGHTVIAGIRTPGQQKKFHEKGIETIIGDITHAGVFTHLPDALDVVIHAAGILGAWGVGRQAYYEAHVRGTAQLMEACARRKVKRMIYISSAGVLGYTQKGGVLNEDSAYNPQSDYECAKAEAEKYVVRFSKEHSMETVILRPEFLYGEGNTHILGLFKAIENRCFFLIADGTAFVHPTYIGDLLYVIDRVIRKKTPSAMYMVAGARFLSVCELARLISDVLGVRQRLRKVPYRLAHTLAHVSEVAACLFHRAPVWSHSRLDFFTQGKACCFDRAALDLEYVPVKLEEGLLRTINWYKEHGYL